jgi:hypothetical protein
MNDIAIFDLFILFAGLLVFMVMLSFDEDGQDVMCILIWIILVGKTKIYVTFVFFLEMLELFEIFLFTSVFNE